MSIEEVRASPCSSRVSLVGVVEVAVLGCSEEVQEDVPFRDILVCASGLPVQLYRDVTASERESDGSALTWTPGHQKKN